ncbi:MAG: hypothetical protein KGP28_11365 [Bdellovibrionales bacterium]|nr:hypothetical protein [Bdellovibrionales bacterium]
MKSKTPAPSRAGAYSSNIRFFSLPPILGSLKKSQAPVLEGTSCFISTPNNGEHSQFETSRIPIYGFLLALASLTACGPASDMVTVKLVTGLEKSPAQTNFLRTLSAAPFESFTVDGFPCIQNDVRVGYSNPITKGVVGFPVRATTTSELASADGFPAAMTHVAFPEIRLEVPRNTPIDIGIVGAITTGAADSNGICKSFEVNAVGDFIGANPSYSIFGSTEFSNGLSNEAVIPIRVWGTLASTGPSTGSSDCIGGDCPGRRFVAVTSPPNTFFDLRIRFFEGGSAEFEMFLNFPIDLSMPTTRYIPKAGRIHAQYLVAGNTWNDCIPNGSNQILIDNIPSAGIPVSCGSNSLTFTALAP